ncbi:MAG: spore coat protein U domain-containing protein [Candidatus Thermoplasmatota archaeon]|jgi:hypothetical protein
MVSSRVPILFSAFLLLTVAAAPSVAAVDLGADLLNVAPTILSISLSGLTSGTLTPSSGTTASVTATVVAVDTNGFADITGVTVGIIKPDGSTIHLAQAAASFSSGSLLSATYTKTLNMNFYDAAALTTDTYKVKAIATDAAAATGTNLLTLAVFNYGQLVAVNAPASLSLGSSLTPGVAGSIVSLGLQNYGNVQMDSQISGTALSFSSNSMPVGSLAYSLASDLSGSAALTGSAVTLSSFDLGSGASSSKNVYFQLTPPEGLPAGTYTGTLTVAAISG